QMGMVPTGGGRRGNLPADRVLIPGLAPRRHIIHRRRCKMAPDSPQLNAGQGSIVVVSTSRRNTSQAGARLGGTVMYAIEKTVALLDALTVTDVQALPPAQRRRFADMCKHWASLADRADAPKAGVLSDLKRGTRYE